MRDDDIGMGDAHGQQRLAAEVVRFAGLHAVINHFDCDDRALPTPTIYLACRGDTVPGQGGRLDGQQCSGHGWLLASSTCNPASQQQH